MPIAPIEMVFLHPLPFDGAIWAPFRDRFPEIHTSAPELYSLGDTLTEVALAVLDLVVGDRLIVVGNSIGGSCAVEIAAAAPDRVEHLVLIGTKAGHRPEPAYRDAALALLATEGIDALWEQVWRPLFSSTTPPAVIEAARLNALAVGERKLATGVKLFHGRRDLDHVIADWPKPLTVVTGADDTTPGPAKSRDMVDRAASARLHVVPTCGHYVPLEQPETLMSILNEAAIGLT